VEALNTTTIRRLTTSRRHQLPAIAPYGQVNQLRDPAIFEENGRVYLLYAVAGESGIAIAEVLMGE
jgi:hypothetical protein